jgi:GNAT superfamily N-acetyltransferase
MSTNSSPFTIRRARMNDRNHLRAMQIDSMRRLAIHCYSREEVEAFIADVGTMDDQLIGEGTYYLVEVDGHPVASGGWSRTRGNYVGTPPVDPKAAKIRSVFVHPNWARHGFGRLLMNRAEQEAVAAGFGNVELNALLSGVPFYRALGYQAVRSIALGLPDGVTFHGLTMVKPLGMAAVSTRSDKPAVPQLPVVPAAIVQCVELACGIYGCAA